jgi:ADP-heptose:LPS heptosyltransferase
MARSSEVLRQLDFWVGVPALGLAALLRRRQPLPAAPRRIGVISPTAIGDLILQTGLLAHLQETYPAAEIHLFHGPTNAGAVPLLPLHGAHAHPCDFKKLLATVSTLRRARLDVLIDLTPWPRLTALCAALSGACTVGFDSERQFRQRAFDVAVPHLRARHETENLRAMAQVFAACARYRPRLRLDPAPPALVLPFERLVLCHIAPGGSRALEKSWPAANWAELARRLAADGYTLGFTGTKADAAAVDSVLEQVGLPASSAFSLCGKLSLIELARTLRAARLLLTIDTGVLHLGAALDAPTVALHGPTRSARWGASSVAALSLDAPHAAAGFIHFGFENHPQAAEIMATLRVERVYQAAIDRLAVSGVSPANDSDRSSRGTAGRSPRRHPPAT